MSDAVDAHDFEVTNFQTDVLDASYDRPVVVDFWAPWCGPCKTLGPILEEMTRETDEWTLVKVNTDDHTNEARKYGVRGIPAVKLFIDGAVADEFTGALPRHKIEQWLEQSLPSETAKTLHTARERLDAGETEAAVELLEEVTAGDPSNHDAHVLLARAVMFDDPERAAEVLTGHVTDAESQQIAETVDTITGLLRRAESPDRLPEEEGKDTYLEAIEALADQDFDTAIERFIQVIQKNRYYDDDGSRRACVAIFTLLGPRHEITRKHRRTFDMSLY